MLATGEVKCIDEEIPFDVPQGWEWCRIGELISYQNGYAYTSSELNKECKGMPVIKSGNLMTYEVVLKPNNDYVEKPSTKMLTSVINKGDLLMCLSSQSDNPEPLGKTAIYKANTPALLNQRVLKMRPWLAEMLEYMYYVINSEYFHYTVSHQGGGSAQANLKLGHVLSMLVPLAPLEEEVRIVDKITAIMPLVLQYETTFLKQEKLNIEINNRLKSSILQEAIQGKLVPQIAEEGSAQELLEQIKEEKRRLVREGKLKKSALNDSVIFRGDDNKYYEQIGKKCRDITEQIPFEIPSNWEWCRVRNVSNSYIGLTYKPTDIDEKGTIVLRSCNIRNGKLALDDIVRVSSSISEKMLIEENDIIICARNGSKRLVGKSALIRNLPEPMTFGAFMAICKTPIYEYMFAYLQSDLFFGQLRDVSNTTTINQLTQNKFNDFLIPIPPVREQERIAFKISQLFQELR
ncbi:restriction endonuclease subunit S [Bacteroides ovatus]|uniref:restriction endonuclease subunit S n=1 Tax=Bacteroides ovatus TaxID=28116 RepID=UPI0039B41AB7